MKKFTKVLAGIVCVALSAVSVMAVGCGQKKETITVSGSSSVTPLMQALAAEYEATHDNVQITINMSSSGTGISDTQKGLNDFGMSSRELKSTETGVKGVTLCMDGIALIVNNDCTVDNVSKADAKALFESGTAIPDTTITAGIGRDASSGTRSAFDELIGLESYATSVSTLAETGNVIEAIQASKNSLGYISFGSVSDKIKTVSLDGVACTVANITAGTYTLSRPFVIVLKDGSTLSEAAQGFYDYIMGATAQSVISSKGYISVNK